MLQNFDLFKASDFKCMHHNKKITQISLDQKPEKRIYCSECAIPSQAYSFQAIDEVISKQAVNSMAQKSESEVMNVSNHVNQLLTHNIDKLIDNFIDVLNKFRFNVKKHYQNLIEEEFKEKSKRSVDALNQILKTFWTNGKVEEGKYLERYIQTYLELADNSAQIDQLRSFCDSSLTDMSLKIKSEKEEMKKKTEEMNNSFSNREALLQKIFASRMTTITMLKSNINDDGHEIGDDTPDLSEIRLIMISIDII